MLCETFGGGVCVRYKWLKDYHELEEQILYLKWNLNKSKLELERWVSGDLVDVRIEKNSRSSSLENNIEKITKEIELLTKQKQELVDLIGTFEGLENDIVRLKYINHLTIEDIAEQTGYSISYIRKRHTEIRKTLKFVDEYESRRIDRLKKENEIDYYNIEHDQISLF